jgi:hypothetical protein
MSGGNPSGDSAAITLLALGHVCFGPIADIRQGLTTPRRASRIGARAAESSRTAIDFFAKGFVREDGRMARHVARRGEEAGRVVLEQALF